MRNLWVAGRALTSACTYLAHTKPVLDGSSGRGMRARPGSAQPVAVPAVPSKGHRVQSTRPRTCPAPGLPVLSRSAARVPAARRGAGPGAAERGHRAARGPPKHHPRPPQRRPQRRTMRGRPATHLSRGRAGCPPGPRLPGALWDRDFGMPATGKGTGRVGSREHGERPDSSGCGERLWHVAVQPLIAARRFPPLRGPSPAPAPPGRRADAPSSHAQPRSPPARPPGPALLTAGPAPGARRPACGAPQG